MTEVSLLWVKPICTYQLHEIQKGRRLEIAIIFSALPPCVWEKKQLTTDSLIELKLGHFLILALNSQ